MRNISINQLIVVFFIGILLFSDFSKNELKKIIRNSYKEFNSDNVVKFSKVKKFNLIELYHGPTLAFKDIAMQVIGNMYETILSKSKNRINLVTATSGDTGAAAIDAVKNKNSRLCFNYSIIIKCLIRIWKFLQLDYNYNDSMLVCRSICRGLEFTFRYFRFVVKFQLLFLFEYITTPYIFI